MSGETKRILILCKTYPSPSARYVETSCVAGMEESGRLVRLYPVPFRLIEDEHRFKKWQWVRARVRKAQEDHRPESYRISVDTIDLEGDPLPARDDWPERRRAIAPLEVFSDFAALEHARLSRGVSLALLRPSRLIDLQITGVAHTDWSEDEIAKLMQAQQQLDLFQHDVEQRALRQLRKLPYDFHYHYECDADGGPRQYKHKLVDWEAGALYWNIHRRPAWQTLFRDKWLTDFGARDLHFLMGNIHRFQGTWLVVSVLYFPQRTTTLTGDLFDASGDNG